MSREHLSALVTFVWQAKNIYILEYIRFDDCDRGGVIASVGQSLQ